MRGHGTTEQDSASGVVLSAPWRVTVVEALPDYRVKVRFIDGTEGVVVMSRLICGERAGVFAGLRDPAVFAQASVELGTVTWPGEIDLAPDAMHIEIKKNGKWVL